MNSIRLIGVLLTTYVSWAPPNTNQPLATQVLSNLSGSAEFLMSLYYIVGLGLIFSGISQLKKLGNRTAFMNADSGVVGTLIRIVIGALLIFSPNFFEVITKTLFNSSNIENQLAYPGTQTLITHLAPIIFVIQFIGMVAILRGFLILTKATGQGAQPGTLSKGFVHIFGGALAVNIVKTVDIVTSTFGLT